MGGDGLVPNLILGMPLALIVATLIGVSGINECRGLQLTVTPAIAALLALHLFQLTVISFLGNHSCGPSFNNLISYTHPLERWIPVPFFVTTVLIGWLVWRPRDPMSQELGANS